MKECFYTAITLLLALTLISWGNTGHKAVAQIAANHLTDKTRQAIQNLLKRESLADASTWADEIKSEPRFKFTGAWHYADLPSGYSFEQFEYVVKNMPQDNVYKTILRCEDNLRNPARSKKDKVDALKFIVHLIGDLHQPMHVGHTDDRGGNSTSVTFMNMNTNLHSLWDSGLIDHEGIGYQKMATTYDTATVQEIKKWQTDPIMVWLWESYQISTILYQEIKENPDCNEDYYNYHMATLQKRIEKGGIRLAGVLNSVFDK